LVPLPGLHRAAFTRWAAAACSRTSTYPVWMPATVATNIIVFGRGLVADDHGFQLTQASTERVEALIAYVKQNRAAFNSRHGRIVFSGGWAAVEGIEPPPNVFREGSLMLGWAEAADIDGEKLARYADTYAEIESDSTLENVIRVMENGYFGDTPFSLRNPLGLVAHEAHMVRIDYLVRKIYRLPEDAVVRIVAPGVYNFSGGLPESVILLITRIAFVGTRSSDSLRRRRRILIACRYPLRTRPFQGKNKG